MKDSKQNTYKCDICNSSEKFLLCDSCFKQYNSGFEQNINNFVSTRNSISKKIDFLLNCNIEKSKKLNKKIRLDKYKQILENKIKEEESKIEKYKEESKKQEDLLTMQRKKNSKLSEILKIYEQEAKDVNNESEFNHIMNIKNEILEMNIKINEFKKKFIFKEFEDLFIKGKSIIKYSDFFNDDDSSQNENDMNFSILNLDEEKNNNNSNGENKNNIYNKIKLGVLKKNDILLKRFNSFFKAMIIFLEKTYNKFKLEMPFKIIDSKIEYKNGFRYNCEINKLDLNNQMDLNNVSKGYYLLNINYIYLMQNIFGDSRKFKDWFDISIFMEDRDDDLGSIDKIIEESKNEKKEEEFNGFVIC